MFFRFTAPYSPVQAIVYHTSARSSEESPNNLPPMKKINVQQLIQRFVPRIEIKKHLPQGPQLKGDKVSMANAMRLSHWCKQNKVIIIAGATTSVVVIAACSFLIVAGKSNSVAQTSPTAAVQTDLQTVTSTPATTSGTPPTQPALPAAGTVTSEPTSTVGTTPLTTKTISLVQEEAPEVELIEIDADTTSTAVAKQADSPAIEIIEMPFEEGLANTTDTATTLPEENEAESEADAIQAQLEEAVRLKNERFFNRVEASLASEPDTNKARKYGRLLTRLKEYERGERFYVWWLKANPEDALTFFGLGELYQQSAQWEQACRVYQRVTQLAPKHLMARTNYAWILATTPDSSVRDGSKALAVAKAANDMLEWPKPEVAECMAAAYAELGDFQAAIRLQKWAIRSAPEEQRPAMMVKLRVFRAKQPFRS